MVLAASNQGVVSTNSTSSQWGAGLSLRQPNSTLPQIVSLTPQQEMVRLREFSNGVHRVLGGAQGQYADLNKVLLLSVTHPSDILNNALTKKEGYASRWFGSESWADWAEDKTSLGKVVALLHDYIQSGNRLDIFTARLDAKTIETACKEATAVVDQLAMPPSNPMGLVEREPLFSGSRRLTTTNTQYNTIDCEKMGLFSIERYPECGSFP
jgi:hypothetical protein